MIVLLSGNFHWVNTIKDVFFSKDHPTKNCQQSVIETCQN